MVGYRWFDQQQLEPQYPFGYGLSYTRFDYSDLKIRSASDSGLDVSVRLRNAGEVAGDEVVQLYLGAPQSAPAGVQFAPRALAGFERVHLGAGETRRVTVHAPARTLQYWSSERETWVTAGGVRTIYVGASERDLRLQADTITPGP